MQLRNAGVVALCMPTSQHELLASSKLRMNAIRQVARHVPVVLILVHDEHSLISMRLCLSLCSLIGTADVILVSWSQTVATSVARVLARAACGYLHYRCKEDDVAVCGHDLRDLLQNHMYCRWLMSLIEYYVHVPGPV